MAELNKHLRWSGTLKVLGVYRKMAEKHIIELNRQKFKGLFYAQIKMYENKSSETKKRIVIQIIVKIHQQDIHYYNF